MKRPVRCRIALVLAGILCCACLSPHAELVPSRHIVMFDGEGRPIDPEDEPFLDLFSYGVMSADQYEEHLKRLFANIDRYLDGLDIWVPTGGNRGEVLRPPSRITEEDESEDAPAVGERKRVLVFIHGGLNQQQGTIGRASVLFGEILKDPTDGSYPIFVNWQSNLVSSYFNHLFFYRQGKDWGGWGLLTSPFVFFLDLARGFGRLPFALYDEGDSFLKSMDLYQSPSQERAYSVAETLELRMLDPEAKERLEVEFLSPPAKSDRGIFSLGGTFVKLPFKMVGAGLVGTFGPGSWDAMVRRVDQLFEREDQFNSGATDPLPVEGLPRFLQELREFQDDHPGVELTLVAHSMGTIVANKILACDSAARLPPAEDGSRPVHPPTFKNIVYMAAACSIQEYQENAWPYLTAHPDTEFYHLTLHDKAEVIESYAFAAPQGSLLVWIDNFLSNVRSPMEFRAGRFTHLMRAIHMTPPVLRSRIHVKSFGTESESAAEPTGHADFNNAPFWRESFWTPGSKALRPVPAPAPPAPGT